MTLMNKNKLFKFFFMLFLVVPLFISGCTTRIADLTVASTKNIDLTSGLDLKKGKRTRGEDCVFVFIFPFGIPNLEEAMDDALEKSNGNIMVDQVAYMKNYSFLIGQNCIEVEGTVLRTTEKRKMKRKRTRKRKVSTK